MPKKKQVNKQGKAFLEERFFQLWNQMYPDLPAPERQFKFHSTRRWRFDFAWPKWMLAVEIQGGSFMRRSRKGGRGGGHNTAIGQSKDYEKHREAAVLGWRLLSFNSHDLQEKLDKKGWRKRTIRDCVRYVGKFLDESIDGTNFRTCAHCSNMV